MDKATQLTEDHVGVYPRMSASLYLSDKTPVGVLAMLGSLGISRINVQCLLAFPKVQITSGYPRGYICTLVFLGCNQTSVH